MSLVKKQSKFVSEILFTISLSFLAFFLVYGFDIFSIFPVAFNSGDYIGYQSSYYSFLDSSWQFPLFNSTSFFIDREINLYLADYIPIYSLALKILDNFFKIRFENPFTIWLFLNCFLTFIYSFKILTLNKKLDIKYGLVGGFLISTLPLAPFKIQYHAGEGSHWVLLAGIYLYLKTRKNTKYLVHFSIFTAITLWIHFYLFSIVFAIWIVSIFQNYKKNKNIYLSIFLFIFLFLIIFLLSFGSYQDFKDVLNNDISTAYNPAWSAELNSFFCGNNTNSFLYDLLKCFEPFTNKNLESYVYLGLGVILFSFVIFKDFRNTMLTIYSHKILLTVSIILLFFSFGNRLKIFHKQIFEYEFIQPHLFLINIYRAHSRFSFLIYYLFVIYFIYKFLILSKDKKTYSILFILFFVIQLQDLNHEYQTKEFRQMKIDTPNIEMFDTSKMAIESIDKRLFVYPPNNCIENYDLHLFSKEFIKSGGTIHSHIIRGGTNYENCSEIDELNKNLINFSPYHFITSTQMKNISNVFLNSYKCLSSNGYFYDQIIYYCYKE